MAGPRELQWPHGWLLKGEKEEILTLVTVGVA